MWFVFMYLCVVYGICSVVCLWGACLCMYVWHIGEVHACVCYVFIYVCVIRAVCICMCGDITLYVFYVFIYIFLVYVCLCDLC